MSYDYVKWIRDMYKYENYYERGGVLDPNFLKNWTDYFSLYGLSVRNLGRVEDFIKKVENMQNSDNLNKNTIVLEFNPRYIISINENRILREYREEHLVYYKDIIRNKEKILNKNNYTFYSLSMITFGGLGPEGLGFTYSTPKGEVIEICSDQKETEAIIIQFKQYLKRKFLAKLKNEMSRFGINDEVRKNVITYLSSKLHPKNLISYQDKDPILQEICTFLYKIDEFKQDHNSELAEIINKITKAVSIILRDIKLEDQFKARMDLVASGKLKPEDIAKLTTLRGKSHFDILRERMFLQNKPKWFFKDYPEEILELEREFEELMTGRYVDMLNEELKLSMQCRNIAVKLIDEAKESGFSLAGKDPKGIAAAAIYIASKISNENRTQKEISTLARVTEVTLRMRVKDLQKYANIID